MCCLGGHEPCPFIETCRGVFVCLHYRYYSIKDACPVCRTIPARVESPEPTPTTMAKMTRTLHSPRRQSHFPRLLKTPILKHDPNVCSQGRDGLIKIWDAERLTSCARTTPLTAQPQEPLLTRTTGAFHFCQFALTRWREEVMPGGQESVTREGGQEGTNDRQGAASDGERGTMQARGVGEGFEGRHRAPGGDGGETSVPEGASSGSFSENTMLAPCHEQNSVSYGRDFQYVAFTEILDIPFA